MELQSWHAGVAKLVFQNRLAVQFTQVFLSNAGLWLPSQELQSKALFSILHELQFVIALEQDLQILVLVSAYYEGEHFSPQMN